MFTNWLTSETSNKPRESNYQPPPDVIVEIGPPTFTRFPAHASILSSQSGFFRAAILRASEVGKLSETPIYIPNITIEHFSPLLTYMYTGYLDLNYENIFGVLLATHLLHMPRALEICRDFLAHTQRSNDFYSSAVPFIPSTSSTTASKVIKPIASKASNLGLNFVSPPKNSSNLLVPSHGTPFKILTCDDSTSLTSTSKPAPLLDQVVEAENKVKCEQQRKVITPKPIPVNPQTSTTRKSVEQSMSVSENDKVIIDIASCDGPVKFRRVLNDAYEKNRKPTLESSSSEMLSDFKYQSNVYASFHQQMIRNIDEQYKQKVSIPSEESENSQQSNDVFTCVYCNLTFKSKYCYQKHAKRHLNPLNSLPKSDCESSDGDSRKIQIVKEPSVCGKRDMKPLDMNVQYYPCKTCGCKFPSYYFVHKHRKMCHPEISDGAAPIDIENKDEIIINNNNNNSDNTQNKL